uniref:Si:ch211-107o10.3 n=1 Tax=Oryzias sinensis TaxID=183150 RepID=A0A8C7XLP0_9TELE
NISGDYLLKLIKRMPRVCETVIKEKVPRSRICVAGARVIMACRDMERANKAAEDVRKRSGNGNVIVKKLDLASLESVRHLSKEVLASEERLDILINNAANATNCPQWKTEDGFEMQFGVNHLGHFLLTNCLLDLLKKSTPSRIVNVSSLAHEKGEIYFDDINLEKDYHPWKSYRQSKLANVLFTRELAKRLEGTGVTTYSLHPGVIKTELGRHFLPTIPLWKRVLYKPFSFFIKSSSQGAQTTIYCAVEEKLQNESGLYYSDCAPKTPAPQALDDEAAKRLWDVSASMVGLCTRYTGGGRYKDNSHGCHTGKRYIYIAQFKFFRTHPSASSTWQTKHWICFLTDDLRLYSHTICCNSAI